MENDFANSTPSWLEKLLFGLFFLPGLLVASVLVIPEVLQPRHDVAARMEIIGLLVAVLCLGGIVSGLFRWKAAQALVATVLAMYWAGVGALSYFVLLSPVFALLFFGVVTIPALIIVGLCTKYARRGLERSWWLGSVITGFCCGFAITVALSMWLHRRT